jgi:hypothetical protein
MRAGVMVTWLGACLPACLQVGREIFIIIEGFVSISFNHDVVSGTGDIEQTLSKGNTFGEGCLSEPQRNSPPPCPPHPPLFLRLSLARGAAQIFDRTIQHASCCGC